MDEILAYLDENELDVLFKLEELNLQTRMKLNFNCENETEGDKELTKSIMNLMIHGFFDSKNNLTVDDFEKRKVEKFITVLLDEKNDDYLLEKYMNIYKKYIIEHTIITTASIKFIECIFYK